MFIGRNISEIKLGIVCFAVYNLFAAWQLPRERLNYFQGKKRDFLSLADLTQWVRLLPARYERKINIWIRRRRNEWIINVKYVVLFFLGTFLKCEYLIVLLIQIR